MWRTLAVLRRNLQNIKKSHRVADENMVVVDRRRTHGPWNGLSVIFSVVRAPFSLVSCFSQPHVNGADGVWVSSHEFAQISEMNHLMRKMSENVKLFIGGISWDTNEEQLKEYFSSFGEMVKTVIMKDRATGRARGSGFIAFSDPAVADEVIKEKHNIDGRMVEAKKAVPREARNIMSRSTNDIQGSPGPGCTKKIFVGVLASTVTESDFKKYFDQFGNITDVVVMYDHNTQRPRGFGFITYDTEEAVDIVLLKNFLELNGKWSRLNEKFPKNYRLVLVIFPLLDTTMV